MASLLLCPQGTLTEKRRNGPLGMRSCSVGGVGGGLPSGSNASVRGGRGQPRRCIQSQGRRFSLQVNDKSMWDFQLESICNRRGRDKQRVRKHGHWHCFAASKIEGKTEGESVASFNPAVEQALVVGAGPAGLAAAIMLVQQGWGKVRVVERLPPTSAPEDSSYINSPERSYNLGVSGRGQKFLDSIGVLEDVLKYSAVNFGRQTWDANGNEPQIQLRKSEKYQAICIQRDRLTAVLLQSARKYSEIHVEHNVDVSSVRWDSEGPEVVLEREKKGEEGADGVDAQVEKLRPSLLIGADGFRSVVAKALDEEKVSPLKIVSYPDTNTRVYKTIPLEYDLCQDPSSWRRDLNFSASSQGNADITLEVLPTKEGKGVGVALFKPGNIAIEECDTADKVKSMVKDNFPQFQDVIPEKAFAEFANQRVQRLPIFQYAANSLVGPQTALVGDSIHTVKPYFGLGVNSAFEDIGVLRDSLQTLQTSLGTLDSSLERYSESHKHNAKAMVQMSRTFDQGFLKFVLPLILDTFFHKLLPQVFSTNCIRILQQHDLPFAQAGAIKRRDRALQIAIISIVLLPAFAVLLRLLKWFVKWFMTA